MAEATKTKLQDLKNYFMPLSIVPVHAPVAHINDTSLTSKEKAQLRYEQANALNRFFEQELDKENYDRYNHKRRHLQWMPDITPADPLWRATRSYIADLLKTERVADTIDEHYEEHQKVLINPQGWSREIQVIGDDESREYYSNLAPGGTFFGELDNVATKLTMVHFGLPVAPIMTNDRMMLGTVAEDTKDELAASSSPSIRQQDNPLPETSSESLDSCDLRSYGRQTMSRLRVRFGECKSSIDVDEESPWTTTVGMRGGSREDQGRVIFARERQVMINPFTEEQFVEVSRLLLKIEEPADFNWSFSIDIYRAETADDIDQRFEFTTRVSRDNFHAQWIWLLDTLGPLDDNPPAIVISHLRPIDVLPPAFREDQDRIKKAFPNDKKRKKQFFLHSYFGKAVFTATYSGFKAAAFKLLDIDPTSDWSFLVDIHPFVEEPITTVALSRKNYRNTFVTEIRNKYLDRGSPVDIFVRHMDEYPVPKTFEPPDNTLNIIRLVNKKTSEEGYWSMPLDMDLRYGINQVQLAFNRAFIALFGRDVPLCSMHFQLPVDAGEDRLDIEYGGMKIGAHQWECIKTWVIAKRKNSERTIRLSIQSGILPGNLSTGMDLFAIRLIGSSECWIGHRPTSEADDYIDIWNQIIDKLSLSQRDGVPSKVRLWFSHTDREQNTGSIVIELFRLRPNGTRKREWTTLEKRAILRVVIRPHIRKDTCIWFRPEYDVYRIYDTEGSIDESPVHWDIVKNGVSLQSFRNALQFKFGQNWEPADNRFTLIDQCNGPDAIYSITELTTEDEWRLYVFDWLSSTKIYIRRRSVQEYSK
ncbi:hypothetical protein ACMFMG_001906 [Clarireedia jacksonii]